VVGEEGAIQREDGGGIGEVEGIAGDRMGYEMPHESGMGIDERASMRRRGNCYDNATMESFWSTLNHELVYRRRFATRSEATTAIFDDIESFL
jgi:hypothetical protein